MSNIERIVVNKQSIYRVKQSNYSINKKVKSLINSSLWPKELVSIKNGFYIYPIEECLVYKRVIDNLYKKDSSTICICTFRFSIEEFYIGVLFSTYIDNYNNSYIKSLINPFGHIKRRLSIIDMDSAHKNFIVSCINPEDLENITYEIKYKYEY